MGITWCVELTAPQVRPLLDRVQCNVPVNLMFTPRSPSPLHCRTVFARSLQIIASVNVGSTGICDGYDVVLFSDETGLKLNILIIKVLVYIIPLEKYKPIEQISKGKFNIPDVETMRHSSADGRLMVLLRECHLL